MKMLRIGGETMFQSDFCIGCKDWPCDDIDSDTEIFECDYYEKSNQEVSDA